MTKKNTRVKFIALLLAVAMMLSTGTIPAAATENDIAAAQEAAGSFVNTTGDGGEDKISLTADRSFKAMVEVDMTLEEAEAAAEDVVWHLDYDESKKYLDPELYPNHTEGGALTDWLNQAGTPLFTDIVTSAEEADGKVYITVTFNNNCYFYGRSGSPDYSAPHSNGGAYMDVCGYFDLQAKSGGEVLGSVGVKISPYDNFHTMAEIYDEIDEIVAFAAENTELYVEKFSMGMSAGDNGLEALDIPYLIIAKDGASIDKWMEIIVQAETDPASLIADIESGEIGDYQVPVMFSNIHANEVAASDGILKFTWMLLEAAAAGEAISYDMLTGFTEAGEAELKNQLGEPGAEGSVAIPDLVADTATYLGYIRAEKGGVSAQVDLEEYYTIETESIGVDALLDDIFLIIVPEQNVEGRTYLTRTSSGGFDLNRDNSFQTQPETQSMTKFIAAWNPVSLTEYHGRVQTFQCEPCDPPHEPNFEYDLLAEHLMAGGEALGIAAVANNELHNSYVIPQRDYLFYTGVTNEDGSFQAQWDPWDDMSTSYTPQYAMLHGCVSYTVEVPAYDDAMAIALAYGSLGQSVYVAENKDSYLTNQARIYERGLTNFNSNAYELVGQWFADVYDVEGAESDLFRPVYDGEGENGNFYPECYIIPLDGANQSNLDAAAQMLEYLDRNDVDIMIADEEFTCDGVTYPAGTAVISMYQAKRSVANAALYDGTFITEWPALYSEGITAFNHTRGFDMICCAKPDDYASIAQDCSVSDEWSVESSFTGETGGSVVILNSSEDSTAAINALLQGGAAVSLITSGDYAGSFAVSYDDYASVAESYLISAVGVGGMELETKVITKAPTVYITGKPGTNASGFVYSTLVSGSYNYNYDRQAMELLGFNVTDDPWEADIIVGASAPNEAALEAIKAGVPYIGYGSGVASTAAGLFAEGALVRSSVSRNSMDALAYVTYPTETLINASYIAEGDDVLYGYGAGFFSAIPEGAQVLVQIDGSKEPMEGFLYSDGEFFEAFLNDSVQAFSYAGPGANGETLDIVLFANTLTNKVHQRDEFNYISNAAFAAVLEVEFEMPEVALSSQNVSVDGEVKDVEAYNIGGYNYFKLRDVAALLTGTGAQFNVDYDADADLVTIVTGEAYAVGENDLVKGGDKSGTCVPTTEAMDVDGTKWDIPSYNIGGYNYLQLRTLGSLLGFEVGYDGETNTALIVTVPAE